MYIRQVHLRNWRSYRNATFNFPTPEIANDRNVILIGAQNGVGKTSFLMSLYLAMFGRESMNLIEGFRVNGHFDEKFPTYTRFIESVLHRSERNSDDPHCSITINFQVEAQQIVIHRRWNFRRGGRVRDLDSIDGEEVLIEVDGRKRLCSTWQDANRQIEEMLFPANVMPCLFFDGEQAQARVEAAGGRALFDAVQALYGTGLLEQLSESLRTFINNERQKLSRDVGTVRVDHLEEKRHQLEALHILQKNNKNNIDAAKKEVSHLEIARASIEHRLYSLVGDKSSDIEEYAKSISALVADEAKLKQELIQGVISVATPLAVSRNGHQIVAELEAELVLSRWLLLKDEARGKANSILEAVLPSAGSEIAPPLLPSQETQLRLLLEKELAQLWSPPPIGCAAKYKYKFFSDTDRTSALSSYRQMLSFQMGDVGVVARELASVTSRLNETRQRFERTRDIQPQLQKLKIELQVTLDQLREKISAVATLEQQERASAGDVADLKAAIGQMEARHEAGSPVQEKIQVAQRLRSLVEDAKERLVPLCKDSLEDQCTLHFSAMISGEYRDFKTKFDSDSEPYLEGPNGQVVLVSSLSGAQKRVFGLAFTLSVARIAEARAPIVIDTPVGNMDSDYRVRVLSYVAMQAPGQVIFLSHDQEISPDYAEKMDAKILKKYLVNFEPIFPGAGVSSIFENQYF